MSRKIPLRPAFPYCPNDMRVPQIPSFQKEYVSEEFVEDGKILHRIVAKSVDVGERMKGLKVNDFSLENQIAIGSEGLNKEFNYIQNADGALLSFEDALSVTPSAPSSSDSSKTSE